MDPSAFIFVGLAVAWAAYLIPKALEHHDAGARSRTVDKFSHTMRVLARREPVDRSRTQLVTGRKPSTPAAAAPPAPPAAPPAAPPVAPPVAADPEQTGFFAAQTFVRRSATSHAARRRRRVLGVILVLTAMVAAVAAGRVISAWWIVAPVTLLVAWLVACRLMVRNERSQRPAARPPVRRPVAPVAADESVDQPSLSDETSEVPTVRDDAPTGSMQRVAAAEPIASGDGWELVPVTLPTYVSKPKARRAISTIDLDSTGVWTSGHTAADSALAQQADAVRAAGASSVAPSVAPAQRRVSGA
ncbi:hypothetical protein SAMN04487968_105152 [Nocardioides terrae]|uniref:Uncharacterized protein n=1 Tax=Nocardioides terrae TaxID=574651 RepID=A0A1I1I6P7_9ACTN|nr:hypothetical protein [Nocardioides terrae]SFC31751.1 hypothetical protein SAMN04487968_105152 [Nocardioides terrae]